MGVAPVELAPSAAQVRWIDRFPARKAVLVALSIVVVLVTGIGVWKTLTLPEAQRYSGAAWRDFVILGLAQGAILALIALGYTLVYGILRMINFAHGEVFMAGAFGSFFFVEAYAQSGFLNRHPLVVLVILFSVAILVSMIVAILLERIAYRPLRGAPRLVPLITAIGASLFLQNSFRGFFGPQTRGFPKPDVLNGTWSIFGLDIARIQVLVFVISVGAMIALQFFVSRTRTGKAMRAVAEDREIASLMGVDVDRVVVITFALGGVLAGIAGVLFALTFEQVHFLMGFRPGIAAFTAAVLGGIGSIKGAALGGFTLGLLQSIGPALFLTGYGIPSQFQLKDAFTFLVLVLVLVFRPGGLLGAGGAEKV